jgi:hypothetical protein
VSFQTGEIRFSGLVIRRPNRRYGVAGLVNPLAETIRFIQDIRRTANGTD